MNTTKKWEKSAQNRRFKAIVYTMACHLILFAGIVYSMNSDIKELIPDFAKEWFWDGEKDLQKEKNSKPSA